MGIKSEKVDVEIRSRTYPKLMESKTSKCLILFTSPGKGTLVYVGDSSYPLGHHIEHWDMSLFQDYTGTLTLKNE